MALTPDRILYEDNHLIIVNKQGGQLSQGDETGDAIIGDEVKAYIKEKYNKPGEVFLGVVHRLDRPVSGAIVFARTSKALERLAKSFRNREVEKVYWAITEGKPSHTQGKLIHYLYRMRGKNITKASDQPREGAKEAELDYRLIASMGKFNLLEVYPRTGRQHQIRVQLNQMGCPIVGDVKYFYPTPIGEGSICLHARSIKFMHPVQKIPIEAVAPLPSNEYWKKFD